MKITIYGPTYRHAAELAAYMNLALRQWEWAYGFVTWANIEPLFERLEELEFRIEGLEK